ncbi:phage tail tape measure protein [Bacillus thuringiensis serovar silo]|uniref:phage tail tape measure protein n=1 Tax=Bacillus thuringiensis TaxID=1428 RepID=UPI000A3B7F61|nr:phage tail tape measure protein [Bacillus thuringiensis]MED3275398.1 phage tail tape measure protein [Bacillus thuringiensis]OTW55311.1 phage tail tape measure protein [Bacillus thuringiensis serovar silo]OTW74257.1 phage tail tape measure protein [Bacillus thuringiensis serovar toguchini]
MSASAGEVRARLVLDNTQFRAGVQQSRADMQGLERGSQNTSKGMSALGKASAIAGVAMVGAIGASIQSAMNFEQSMAKVKAISGATDAEFKQLNDTAKHMGATTQFSASQAAEGLSFLSMAGFKAQDSMDALPSVLNLAAVGGIELGKSADIASNIMTGFGLSAKDTDKAVDILAKTMTTANTDLDMLGMAMKYVAPVSNALGWGMEDTATAIAKMSDAGIQGSQAGTSLRAMLLSLANPTGQTEKAFKKLGISVTDANGQFKPLPELIGHISGKMEGMTDAQKTVTAAQLVGTEASAGFLALISQGQGSLEGYKRSLENAGGTAERVARIQQETLNGAWLQTKSALEGMAIAIGEAMLPAFTNLADGMTGMVGILSKLDPQFVSFGLTLGAVTAGTALVGVGIYKIVTAMKALSVAIVSNPATMWIAGISAGIGVLTAVLMNAKSATKDYQEVNLDTYQQLGEQSRSVEDAANKFDQMKSKVKLSADEMLQYRDALTEVERVEDPAKKQGYIDKIDELAKKSGVSKDELKKYIEANDEMIAKAPATEQAYSTKGNAMAKNSDAARALTKELKEQQRIELEIQRQQAMKNQLKHIEDYKEAVKTINTEKSKTNEHTKNLEQAEKGVAEAKKDVAKWEKDSSAWGQANLWLAKDTLNNRTQMRDAIKQEGIESKINMETAKRTIAELDKKEAKIHQITDQIVEEQMVALELTAERGKEVEVINKALEAEQKKRDKMDNQVAKGKELTDEQRKTYDESVKYTGELEKAKKEIGEAREETNQMQGTWDEATGKVITFNDEAGKDVDKKMNLETDEAKAKNKEVEGEVEQKKDKKMGVDDTEAQDGIKKTEQDIEKKKDKKMGVDKKEADAGIADTDQKALAQKVKKILGDTKQADAVIKVLDKFAEAEKTKKVKADKSQADREIADTDRKALAEKIKKILGDGKQADAVIKELDSSAEKTKTKPIHADASKAESTNSSLVDKILKPATKVISLSWLGDLSPLKYFHSGGTVGASPSNRSTRPKYHNGGSPRGLVGRSPRFDEVDARLLKNEMVLTQAQQANLFNFIRTANRPSTMGAVAPNKGGGKQQSGNVYQSTIQVAELHVREEADVEKVAQELARLERQKQRARGQW